MPQTDHTAYTVTTVGADGFLILLPVYLEHILYPTLTDSGFVTEVHHINGEGENAGVVRAAWRASVRFCASCGDVGRLRCRCTARCRRARTQVPA